MTLPDILLFSWNRQRRLAHARLFAPGYGMPEDPACAPAALGLGLWLAETAWVPPANGTHAYRIRQGLEVSRPASLTCTVTIEDGRPSAGTVTGRVVRVATGKVALPS